MHLRILNVGQNYHIRGGSDQVLFALEALLKNHGHQVIPFATAHPQNYTTEWARYFPPRVNFEHPKLGDLVNYIYSRPAAHALQKLLQDTPIDLAHLHIYYGQLTTSILNPLKKMKIPIVQTLHEYKIVCPVYTLLSNGQICEDCGGYAFWKAVFKRCNRGSLTRSTLSAVESYVSRATGTIDKIDHFIAVSQFVRDKVIQLGVPADKVTVIYNFIDATNIIPNSQPGKYFLFVGRLEKLKGIFTLLEAASGLRNIPLLIVGDGSARPEIERQIIQNGWDHIRLLGFKKNRLLQDLIRKCICIIAPSEWYETFGLVLIEAFAHGRPVIASRIGGMTEIVSEGKDGFLITPGDAQTLRKHLEWFARHQTEAVEMGAYGRRKVDTIFSPEIHYQKTIALYKKVLKQ